MRPRVFFSFHYHRDIWRANQVRNSWRLRGGEDPDGRFVDASLWEETKKRGDTAVQALIDDGLKRTQASVILIGRETWKRRWVKYEIEQSWTRDNAMVGVRIHKLRNGDGTADDAGRNPFDYVATENGRPLSEVIPVYDWMDDDGYNNLVPWIEQAPRASEIASVGVGKALAWGAGITLGALALREILRRRQGPPGYL